MRQHIRTITGEKTIDRDEVKEKMRHLLKSLDDNRFEDLFAHVWLVEQARDRQLSPEQLMLRAGEDADRLNNGGLEEAIGLLLDDEGGDVEWLEWLIETTPRRVVMEVKPRGAQDGSPLTNTQQASMTLTANQRIALLREVYEAVTGSVESLEHDDRIGPDLAYLLGAILNDTGCTWPSDRPIIAILRALPGWTPCASLHRDREASPATPEGSATNLPTSEEPTMKRAQELSREQLVAVIDTLQGVLWNEGGSWNADKTWDAETIESVAAVLEDAGLRPPQPSDIAVVVYEPVTPVIRPAVGDARGYTVRDEWIAGVLRQYAAAATSDLQDQLRVKEEEFQRTGGRGIDLAEEIDSLRLVLAIRQAAR